MKVVTAIEEYYPKENDITLFLAGGISNCPDWQKYVIETLKNSKLTENLVVFNPRRDSFPIHDSCAVYDQIEWEFNMLERSDIFSIYFSDGESDQPICMYELGRNIPRMQMRFPKDWQNRIVITCNENYKRFQDALIQTELAVGEFMVNLGEYKNHAHNIIRTLKNGYN